MLIDAIDTDQTVERCLELIARDEGAYRQVSVNAAKVVAVQDDPELRDFVRNSSVVSADGQSIVWTSRVLGDGLPERVAGIDLMVKLVARAAQDGLSVYFLGARQDVLDLAVTNLEQEHPNLIVAGTRNGYFADTDAPAVAEAIRSSGADLLFVGMSSPRKEQFLARHLEATGVRFGMGVGGALDVVGGVTERAPVWMQRSGLEWLFRLSQEPGRLWRRYLVTNARFSWLVLREVARLPRRAG